jgi:Cu-processing system ATP-binding protein
MALRYGADVVILDEPTAGLDPVAARVLKDRVHRERERGCTVLLTSHDLGQLQAMADDVVFLLDGSVRFEGEITDLLDATGQTELEGAIATLIHQSPEPDDEAPRPDLREGDAGPRSGARDPRDEEAAL